MHPTRFAIIALLLASGLPLLAQTPVPPASPSAVLNGDPAHPAAAQNWVETRLFFGLGPATAPRRGISELRWRHFLDTEITPRFPSGLSVIDLYGQWQRLTAAGQLPRGTERIRSKMVLIDYPPTPENDHRIESIRSAWKALSGDQSVLKVTQPVDVSF